MSKDVTLPQPVPEWPQPREVIGAAVRHAGLVVLGGVFLVMFLLFVSAVFGFFFTYLPWLLVLAFFGWPLVRLFHVVGRWVVANSRRI